MSPNSSKQRGLRDILKTESALVSEIRTLDGERKALVYDNYSKLIKAVGTIAEMQKGMHKDGQQDTVSYMLAGTSKEQQPVGIDGVKEVGEKLDGLLKVVKDLGPAQHHGATQKTVSRKVRRQKETVKLTLDAPVRLQKSA